MGTWKSREADPRGLNCNLKLVYTHVHLVACYSVSNEIKWGNL